MKLVNGFKLMEYAKRNNFVLPAFNTTNLEMTYAIVVGPEGDDTDSCICVDVSDGEVAEADKNDSTIITFSGESNKNDFVAHALFDVLNDIERVGAKFTSNSDYEMDEIIEEIISLKLEGYEDGI